MEGVEHVRTGQFFLGPTGSGAPAHFHRLAINLVAFGEKHWFMYPPHHPQAAYTALTTTAAWLSSEDYFHNRTALGTAGESDDVLLTDAFAFQSEDGSIAQRSAEAAPIQFVQREGDVVIVPEEWTHATWNRQNSIGVAHEVSFVFDVLLFLPLPKAALSLLCACVRVCLVVGVLPYVRSDGFRPTFNSIAVLGRRVVSFVC